MLTIAPREPSSSIGSVWAIAAAERLSMLNVPIKLTLITKLNRSRSIGTFSRSIVRAANPMPAEFTSARSGPSSEAAETVASASSVDDTSHFTNKLPISAATACPFSSSRSAITTCEPASASWRALASPIPDAPPVTMEELPSRLIRGIDFVPRDVGDRATLGPGPLRRHAGPPA